MPTRLLVIIAAVAAILLVACGDDDEDILDEDEVRTAGAQGQSLRVTAVDFAFEPNELGARGGEVTEIIFVNEGDADHTFTIDGLVDEELEAGGQVQFTFTAPTADAEFYCRFHEDEMRGTLVIDPTDEPRTDGAPTVDASDGATPDETDDDDDDDDDDDNSGTGSDNSESGSDDSGPGGSITY